MVIQDIMNICLDREDANNLMHEIIETQTSLKTPDSPDLLDDQT